ncbi:alanine/glycine:cation symporter family protein [Gulosibacter molinativorax]|uniref:Sodium:alanine symporter family protein n=1 Tax=Gulosibacter molinativorax TaxID=256821 RepID=A0ABT7C9R1_9MICO|nr:sodium:alanine symporter family protein [Gulosibacter molinativorax]MDJ1371951.1 sodium:alanine symporter family protein [Gulosibacter molinativorax]QUY62685.1 Amino acid carrier protein [Gulosibacter molinativorax]
MDQLQKILDAISGFVWGPWLLIPLLLGTGIFLTIRLRFIQFRKLGPALNLGLIRRNDDTEGGDISQYQALTTALAATVGVGNIVGVATAIAIGGPGALFWMWVTGLFGMASKYAEAFLGVRFRKTDANGDKSGGPQYYLERGIKGKFGRFLAIWFAVFAVFASFGIGNMTQGNAVATQLEGAFNISPWVTGIVLTILIGLVLLGGIKSIGKVTAAFVPAMIVLYIVFGMVVLIANGPALPGALAQVFTMAFSGTDAVAGGFTGSAIMLVLQMGVARGIFSNESGMGSAAIAAAAAKTTHPVRQGLVSMTQTFIDTIIVVTFTGLTIVATGVWETGNANGEAGLMTSHAFATTLGDFGNIIVALSIAFFAFSTILGWAYYGERCMERLFGVKGVPVYRIVFTLVVFIGCTVPLALVWTFADIMNGLMALPNLIGLLVLSGLIARETKHYLDHDPKLRASASEIDAFMEGHERHDADVVGQGAVRAT